MTRRLSRALHRLRFNLWLLGANDVDAFDWRARILGRVRRKLLHGPTAPREAIGETDVDWP